MNGNEMTLLRASDPLTGTPDDASFDLGRIRAELDLRIAGDRAGRPPVNRSRRVRRQRLLIIAATIAVALLGSLVLSLVRPGSGPSLAGVSAALDSTGKVVCHNASEAASVAPAEAARRLLPTYLPTGWTIGRIWATRAAFRCEQTPSLTAAVLAQDGKVLSSVMVRGPLDFSIDVAAATTTDTTVGGAAAKSLVPQSEKGPGERIWLWQVGGKTWFMKSYGFYDQANRALERATRVERDQVRIDPATAPANLQVISQRTGPPYKQQTIEEWHVTLGRGDMIRRADGEVWMRVAYIPGGPLGQDGVFPDGQYVTNSNGQWTIRQQSYGGMGIYEGQPGVSVTFDPPWAGGEPTLGSMSAADWVKVVTSLQDVPAADPRLTALWAQS